MGPIAARTLLEMIECVADIVGIEVLLAAQALDLRMKGMAFDGAGERIQAEPIQVAPKIAELHQRVRLKIPYWSDDEVLHPCLKAAGTLVRSGEFLGQPHPW